MTGERVALLHRLLPQTLFGRLACLMTLAVITSHFLALKLMFEMGPNIFGPRPPPLLLELARHAPLGSDVRPGPPGGFDLLTHWNLWLDVAVRLSALLLVTWVGVRWLAQPVRGLADAAMKLGRDVRSEPLVEIGTVECREAIRVFNQMQARICQQLDERDSFVAAVSHDLRTPLTRLALRVEALPDVLQRARFRHDIAEMNNMIAVTLDYMRDVAASEPLVWLDLESMLTSMTDDYVSTGAHVRLDSGREALCCGVLRTQPQALRRCISNLLDNAVRYGGSATMRCYPLDGAICIEIADQGNGVSESELHKITQPFYRSEGSRNRHSGGVGLGLSIASDIAQRLQGTLTLSNRPQGGLLAILTFPLSKGSETDFPLHSPAPQS
jgi:signal transduction histidine kinase